MKPLVGIIMGSTSDWETLRHAAEMLERLGVPHEVRVVSAHRTPDLLFEYAAGARDRQHLFAGQERRFAGARRMCKRAISADVPAKLGQRNEHLAGIGDDGTMRAVAAATCSEQQGFKFVQTDKRSGVFPGQVPFVREVT